MLKSAKPFVTSVSATISGEVSVLGGGQGSIGNLDRTLMLPADHERPGELAVEGNGPGIPGEVGELQDGRLEDRQRSVGAPAIERRRTKRRNRAGSRRAVTETALDLGRLHEVALRGVVVGRQGSRMAGTLQEEGLLRQVGRHAERLL